MSRRAARQVDSAPVARAMGWVAAGHAISQLTWLATLLLVASLVAPGAFGSVSVAMVVVQVAWLLVGSGTRGALIVGGRVSRSAVERATTRNVLTGLAAGLAAALAAGPLLSLLAPGADPRVLQALGLAIALFGFSIVPLALLQKSMHFRAHASANAGAAVIASAAAAAAALAGLGVWALVIRQVLFQALIAVFAWTAARGLVPERRPGEPRARRDPVARWFFALAVTSFVSLNVDYVVVARHAGVHELGLYSLAFTLAFAPVTQFAWQIGKVLFASAARSETTAAPLCVWAVRVTALLVWPPAVLAVALAPQLLPALLGPEWEPMIVPFQLLVAVGAGHAVLAVLREFVLGRGAVRACAAIDAAWLGGTVAALLVLVPARGIEGAAMAHLLMLGPLALAYAAAAARAVGVTPAMLWRSLRLILLAVGVQAALTGLEGALAAWAGAAPAAAALIGVASGAVALLLLLEGGDSPPRAELAAIVRAARETRAPALGGARAVGLRSGPTEPLPNAAVFTPTRPPTPPATASEPSSAVRLAYLGLALAAVTAGMVAMREPRMALACVAVGLAWLLATRAPALHLLALVALTTLVPLSVQARFGSGGGIASAGVLPSDVLLLTGLASAALVVPRMRVRRVTGTAMLLTALFLCLAAVQVLHALALGRPISGVGGEFRALLGFGALFVALPVLADARQRPRVLAGAAWLGLALGVWGIAQFALHLRFEDAEAAITPGTFETAGRVVGLFGFPVAATIALAALSGGVARGSGTRALLAAVLVTNALAVVLTFERTFLAVTLAGFALVFARAAGRQRARLAIWTPAALGVTALCVALLSPAAMSAYKERLLTLARTATDASVQYRLVESRLVGEQVRARPLTGSALGATILIGRPGTNVPPVPRRLAENGYLWLAWKLGVPGLAVMCGLLALAVLAPGRRGEGGRERVLRRGAQAALAALALASVSFPSFNQAGITALMGVLVAAGVAEGIA